MKMKKMFSCVLIVCLIAGMAFPSMAAVQLPAPSWVKWTESAPLTAEWEVVEEAGGMYQLEMFRNGQRFQYARHRGNVKGRFHAYRVIEESGTYTFRVKALGDDMEYSDSEWSEISAPYVYKRPKLKFEGARNLRWSATEEGMAEWDAPKNIPVGQEENLWYDVTLYADGEPDIGYHLIRDNKLDWSSEMTENVQYTFSVKTISSDIENIAHGPEVINEDQVNVPEINEEVLGNLQDLYLQMSDEIASPSDTEDALEEMDITKMAIAVQSSEETLDALRYVEEEYITQTGKTVEKVIGNGVDLEAEDIDIIGAGLNIASDSNAIQVNVRKPDREAQVDTQLYKNVVQFDIGLTNAISKLRAPVTIIIPIPKNIQPERLMILHYHRNGSYEMIWPVITEDGRAKFTVTEFSIFAFAERVENEKPEEPERDRWESSDDDDHGSANSAGKWVWSALGWWYQNGDGSWPVNCWRQLEWDGVQNWYLFGEDGYLKTGWQDWNGKRYYLHPFSDGTQGYMYTGQKLIDEIWYYFDEDGALIQ